jgi:hypothetical protein
MHKYRLRDLGPGTAPPSLDIELVTKPAAWENLDEQYGLDLNEEEDEVGAPVALQTVDEEYSAYTTATLSPWGTDMLAFWQVRY